MRYRFDRFGFILSLFFLCFIFYSALSAGFFPDESVILSNKRYAEKGNAEIKEAIDNLIRQANDKMTAGPFSVIYGKTNPAGGDPHDYCSMSPYWWPDPDKPDGLPYIRKDGLINPERLEYDKTQSADLQDAVETLTLAYVYTGDSRYAQRAADLIRIWFLDDSTRMNPNMNYAQFVPGRHEGRSYGIIESRVFLTVLNCAQVLSVKNELSSEVYEELMVWTADFLHWLMTSDHGKKERKAVNNHGSWFDVQAMGFAMLTQQNDIINDVAKTLYRSRIKKHILPDGRQPEELQRTRAFFYSGFNLNAITRIYCMAMSNQALSVSESDKIFAGIQRALNYLYPYAIAPESWPYDQIRSFDNGRFMLADVLLMLNSSFPDSAYAEKAARIPLADADRQILILRYGFF
jgi:hypothetical protein